MRLIKILCLLLFLPFFMLVNVVRLLVEGKDLG